MFIYYWESRFLFFEDLIIERYQKAAIKLCLSSFLVKIMTVCLMPFFFLSYFTCPLSVFILLCCYAQSSIWYEFYDP